MVGSSSSSRSGAANSVAASATRMRQPPENSDTGRAWSAAEKPRPAEDRGRAGRRGVRVDIDQPGLDFGDPVRVVRGIGFAQQRVALEVGLEHDFDQALRAVGRFLGKAAHAPARRDGDAAAFGGELAADGAKQRRFAGAVAADQPDARARRDLHRGVVDQKPPGKADGDVLDGKHARVFTAAAAKRNPASPKNPQRSVIEWRRFRVPALSSSTRRSSSGAGAHEMRAQAVLQAARPRRRRSIGWSCDRSARLYGFQGRSWRVPQAIRLSKARYFKLVVHRKCFGPGRPAWHLGKICMKGRNCPQKPAKRPARLGTGRSSGAHQH